MSVLRGSTVEFGIRAARACVCSPPCQSISRKLMAGLHLLCSQPLQQRRQTGIEAFLTIDSSSVAVRVSSVGTFTTPKDRNHWLDVQFTALGRYSVQHKRRRLAPGRVDQNQRDS
jgi:hypothetical protein